MKLPPEAPEETKDLDHLKPIDHAVIALPHTPVYKMHRYFARRPWSVFRELIKHYSNPSSVVLDPFSGGGVTLVEGLATHRKVFGVDFNPIATFITAMELASADLKNLRIEFDQVRSRVAEDIRALYKSRCRKCKGEAHADWYEWSNVYECSSCGARVVTARSKKLRWGTYLCSNRSCASKVVVTKAKRLEQEMTRLKVVCSRCDSQGISEPEKDDIELAGAIQENFEETIKKRDLWYPTEVMPLTYELRRPYNMHCKRFIDFFTSRNLLALSVLFQALNRIEEASLRRLLKFNFSACLFEVSILTQIKNNSVVKPGSTYWISDVHGEKNVWLYFENRFNSALIRGKEYSSRLLGSAIREAKDFGDILDAKDYLLLAQSSTRLPAPNDSVDVIITDPPYGGNVMYSEICNFWFIWLRDELGYPANQLIPNQEEAIQTKAQNKDIQAYRDLMCEIFKECRRVLKPQRWMVMTFHNREFKVWNALHLAAHDAGFVLAEQDGMIYQPPIQAYTTTVQLRREGSMLGDFILSFQKAERLPQQTAIDYVEVGKKIEQMAAEVAVHHQGATLSMIYMKLIPFLLNNNLLDKIGEKEVAPHLRENFYEQNGKWYLKENPSTGLDKYLSEYSRSHYKEEYRYLSFIPVEARLEYLVRRFLYEKGSASQDEILNEIYSNLINSNAAEYGEITRVLNRIAALVTPRRGGRKLWRLKEILEKEKLLLEIEEKAKEVLGYKEESTHDLVIRRLVSIGAQRGYVAHIGRTEQKKYTEFRNLSKRGVDLLERLKLPNTGMKRIAEIDVLWLKERTIGSAFEVEKTTTIDSGISRFRELFAALPGLPLNVYLVIPKDREAKARETLLSPANVKESLTKKVGYMFFEDLKVDQPTADIEIEHIARTVT